MTLRENFTITTNNMSRDRVINSVNSTCQSMYSLIPLTKAVSEYEALRYRMYTDMFFTSMDTGYTSIQGNKKCSFRLCLNVSCVCVCVYVLCSSLNDYFRPRNPLSAEHCYKNLPSRLSSTRLKYGHWFNLNIQTSQEQNEQFVTKREKCNAFRIASYFIISGNFSFN